MCHSQMLWADTDRVGCGATTYRYHLVSDLILAQFVRDMIIDHLSERGGGTPHYILATMVLEATTSADKCIGEVLNKRIY